MITSLIVQILVGVKFLEERWLHLTTTNSLPGGDCSHLSPVKCEMLYAVLFLVI